jgi:ubiquinone/menaquinone biosynthesis C-methylase UbiE
MNDETKIRALTTYFDLMAMNGGARIYRVARECGIFDAMEPGKTTPEELARKCGLHERPVKLLLDALCSIKTVQCDAGLYSLTPVMQFLSGNYKNLSDEYWDHLPQLLKTGVPLAKMDAEEQSEAQYQKQVAALAWMMMPAAEAAAVMLGISTTRTQLTILDVGAGSAVWSLAFARKDPKTTVTALDWPAVLTVAAASAQAMGLQDRFATIAGNYHEVTLPVSSFTLAIVGNVTHIETPEGNLALFRKLHAALKPGGEIVIFDIMPGREERNLAYSLYALGLALRTEKGQVYSCKELYQFLEKAGFTNPAFSPIDVPPFTMGMILATKEK